jgi:ankyrin repeat protein
MALGQVARIPSVFCPELDFTKKYLSLFLANYCQLAQRRAAWWWLPEKEGMGHVHIMRLFLQCGAYINAQDNYHLTPLHLASHKGELEATRLLLQCGAKVDAQTNDGQTPLHYVSQGNY